MRTVSGAIFLIGILGCADPSPEELATEDVEIERAILWEYRKDRRFEGIRVQCRAGLAELQGHVSSEEAAREALIRAQKAAREAHSRARVVSKLKVRD